MSDLTNASSDDEFNELQSNMAAMRAELTELENAILHLLQTNRELRDEHAADAELAAVVVENEEVIARKTARVQRLRQELAQLDANATFAPRAPAAPPPPPPPASKSEIHL